MRKLLKLNARLWNWSYSLGENRYAAFWLGLILLSLVLFEVAGWTENFMIGMSLATASTMLISFLAVSTLAAPHN